MAVPFHTPPVPSARGFTQTILITQLHSTDFSLLSSLSHTPPPPPLVLHRGDSGPDQHSCPSLSLHRSQSVTLLKNGTVANVGKHTQGGKLVTLWNFGCEPQKSDWVFRTSSWDLTAPRSISRERPYCRTNASCRDACVSTHRLPFFSAAKARPIVARLIRPAYLRSFAESGLVEICQRNATRSSYPGNLLAVTFRKVLGPRFPPRSGARQHSNVTITVVLGDLLP